MSKKTKIIENFSDPLKLFEKWFMEAIKSEASDPNAMNLATISKNFKPSSRIVLLKNFDKKGFVFYTNLKSRKGISILANSSVVLNFYWKSLFRQIRIEGKAKVVSNKDADEYFNSRPRESKISAWASNQSSRLKSRKELQDKFDFYKNKFKNKEISRPSNWKGFRVNPKTIEFWQKNPFRLHDRVEYTKKGKIWSKIRLYP